MKRISDVDMIIPVPLHWKRRWSRGSPRRKNSHWTKLNMDRCIDLEERGLMTAAGRCALEKAYGLNN